MRWAEVMARPSPTTLRQFAVLCCLFFVGLAVWRHLQEGRAAVVALLAGLGVGIGVVGLVWPAAIRWIYTGWMAAAFPVGWTTSQVILASLFYGLFTPIAWLFRLMGRDVLRRRRADAATYWKPKPQAPNVRSYLRQF
jgi:hypothetical protein